MATGERNLLAGSGWASVECRNAGESGRKLRRRDYQQLHCEIKLFRSTERQRVGLCATDNSNCSVINSRRMFALNIVQISLSLYSLIWMILVIKNDRQRVFCAKCD